MESENRNPGADEDNKDSAANGSNLNKKTDPNNPPASSRLENDIVLNCDSEETSLPSSNVTVSHNMSGDLESHNSPGLDEAEMKSDDTTAALPDVTNELKPVASPEVAENAGAASNTPCDSIMNATNEETPSTSAATEENTVADIVSTSTLPQSHEALPEEVRETPEGACAQASEGACAQAPDVTSTADKSDDSQSVYHIKWIKYKENSVGIITQNENGPCPLLAIMNVLLLQGRVKLPPMVEMVTSNQLMEYLADCIFESAPKNMQEDAQLNYEQNMNDAMAVFHKLQTGLDVNVRFTGGRDFEYTPECIVFDLLSIPLYHGWLVDPEQPTDVSAVGNCSYNQLVEKIIAQKSSSREELVREALIAEAFLHKSASQLTYHGLCELINLIKEEEICVFFRNNHFNTLYRYKNELFVLVTDQGFLTESNVVWETLSNVEGDCHFVDHNFHTYRKPEPSNTPLLASTVPVGTPEQIDQDYLVALSLEQEEPAPEPQWNQGGPALSDHELAMQLQEEENRAAEAAAPPAQGGGQERAPAASHPPVQRTASGKEKKSDCIIL